MVFAYIDTGAGSMLIQAVLAGLLAVPFFFRTQVGRALDRVRGLRRSSGSSASDEGR